MADKYPFHSEGAIYVCNNCGLPISDGAFVRGTWLLTALTGVGAFIGDTQIHSCGLNVSIDISLLGLNITSGTGACNG